MSAANQPQPNSPEHRNPEHRNSSAGTSHWMQRLTGRKSWVRGLLVLGLVGVYAAARPAINERTGLNLPALKVDSQGLVVSANADKPTSPTASQSSTTASQSSPTASQSSSTAPQSSTTVTAPPIAPNRETAVAGATKSPAEKKSSSKFSTGDSSPEKFSPTKSAPDAKKPGPLASRAPTQTDSNAKPTSKSTSNTTTSSTSTSPSSDKADPSLHLGLLRDTGGKRYVSPAGLLYTPGSAEGHRIEHVRRHAEDDPGRPGSHGVFDGGIEGALQTIDNAYQRAKEGNRTTKQEEDGRVIYTVDMGKRIGFVGGRDGARKNKPMARRVTLVLEGNRVITAYPK